MVLEAQFTSLILHLASRYIANVDISALRLSLFAGKVVLRNLELRLDPLFAGTPLAVRRAFVRELRIRIPWLRLHLEPIELTLDTVEVVASVGAASKRPAAVVGPPEYRSQLRLSSKMP